MDWRTALRMFAANARVPVRTYARPSRRFPGRVGEIPGRMYASRAVARPTLLVAIDTSLSIEPADLAEVARHLVLLGEQARVVLAQCDVEVTAVGPFEGRLERVAGRGGTDLRPVFEPEFLARVAPDGVVYFTDGEGPFPAAPPPVPTLWVLTRPAVFACPWGQRAVLRRSRPWSPAPHGPATLAPTRRGPRRPR
jgi:predicted metal-dependent peptidase